MTPQPDPGGFVEPAYRQRCLTDVLPAVGQALGCPLVDDDVEGGRTVESATGLALPAAPAYVVFLVDGLGQQLLQRYAYAAPYLASLLPDQPPGTAGVPSTTATSLASLGTALPPGAHGMVGYTSRIPGTTRLLNALAWDREVDPVQWQPHPTALERLQRAGVAVTVVNKSEFAESGLTRAAQRGVPFVGADDVAERIAAGVAAGGRTPSLAYLYDGDLDWTGHRYGVASAEWLQQLSMIDAEAEQLREALPPATRVLVLADHGMVDVPVEQRVDVDDHPALREGVWLLGGEARFRHLYCRSGAVADVCATWRGVLGDRAEVLTREETLVRGWFGEAATAVLPRLGDVLVACTGDTAVLSSTDFPVELSLVGMHGSLTADEMLIPLLVD